MSVSKLSGTDLAYPATMDYHPLEGVFAGVVEISVFPRELIDATLNDYKTFEPAFRYPANYMGNLRQARKVLDRLGGHDTLQVSGMVKPESIKLVTRRQTQGLPGQFLIL